MCRDWLRGANCRFGSRCRFAHAMPKVEGARVPGGSTDPFAGSQSQAHQMPGYAGPSSQAQQYAQHNQQQLARPPNLQANPFQQPGGYGNMPGRVDPSHSAMDPFGAGASGNMHGHSQLPVSHTQQQLAPVAGSRPPFVSNDSSVAPPGTQRPSSRALPSTLKSLFQPAAVRPEPTKSSSGASTSADGEAKGEGRSAEEAPAPAAGPSNPRREDAWQASKFSSTEKIPSTEPTREVCA